MVIWLIGTVLAAPVECDPAEARRILTEARIDEAGVAVTHPWLVPGLALASPHTDDPTRRVLDKMCADGGDLSIRPAAEWKTTDWAAHSVMLTRTETRGCLLFEGAVTLTIGVQPGAEARYQVQGMLPLTQTPLGDCEEGARVYEERVLAGDSGPVRLVVTAMREGDRVTRSQVLVRRATPDGWREQVLADPAPERLLGGFAGPEFRLRKSDGQWLVVQTHDRTGSPDACEAVPGQVAWTWTGEAWTRHENDQARLLLARHGQWRLAGEPGWMLILAQEVHDREELEARIRRLQRRKPDDLFIWDSTDFPGLNTGFLIVTPAPWADPEAARAARDQWGRRATSYVKQAWPMPDPCRDRPDRRPSAGAEPPH